MNMPMLADFAASLAAGTALTLLAVPWRAVPPRFFRTHCIVAMTLLVLAVLDLWRSGVATAPIVAAAAGAIAAYLGSAAWGLGLPRVALPLSTLAGLGGLAASLAGVKVGGPGLIALDIATRLASAALLGTTLSAMLLGHHYLTAPAMSIDPLRRLVVIMAGSLGVRALLAAIGLALLASGPSRGETSGLALFLGMRWGMGIAGPALAAWMAWRTTLIRSTQSATGILYIGMTLVLFGELSALILSRTSGVPL